jgi:hypothetical protein
MFLDILRKYPLAAATMAMNNNQPDLQIKGHERLGPGFFVFKTNHGDWTVEIDTRNADMRFISIRGPRSDIGGNYIFAQNDKGIELVPCVTEPFREYSELNLGSIVLYKLGERDNILIAKVRVINVPKVLVATRKQPKCTVQIVSIVQQGSKAPAVTKGQKIKTDLKNLIALEPAA